MLSSYHVHTSFSDGQSDVASLVRAANEQGLDELGISDHFVVMPGGRVCAWSMPVNRLGGYLRSIEQAASEAREGLRVLKGLEADFFPETVDDLKDLLSPHHLDYVIGSVHFVDGFPIDENAQNWDQISQNERNGIIRGYWIRIAQMARSGLYSFAAHLDLYRKSGHNATVDMTAEIDEALDALAESGMAVEVSTAGLRYPYGRVYPSAEILAGCRRREIPVVISADAHNPESLVKDYGRAREAITAAGYDTEHLWRPRR